MANGLDIGSLIQAAQLGRSLNPEVMQQQALGNQLALQLQQLQAQKIQQDLADPQRALREAAILESIRNPASGLTVLQEGQQALGPVLRPTGIGGIAVSNALSDQVNRSILDRAIARERGLQQVRSEFDPDQTVMVDGVPVLARRTPEGTLTPREVVIPARPTGQFESLAIPQAAPTPPIDESSLQSLIEGSGGALGSTPNLLGGMTLPTSTEIIEPERRMFAEASPRFGSIRGLTPNARLDLARRQGIAGIPESEAILNTPEEKAAYQAALKSRGSPEKLRKEFNSLQQVKSFRELNRQLGLMRAAYSQLKTGASKGPIDQALITTFNKILDPDSVVRESEYARTPEGAALLRRLEGRMQSYTVGGVGFTDQERSDLLQVAEQLFASGEQTYNETLNFYQGVASRGGINPLDVFQGQPATPAPATAAQPSSAPIQIRSITRE